MDGKHHGHTKCELVERGEHGPQTISIVHDRGAVQCDEQVAVLVQAESFVWRRRAGARQVGKEAVNHRVPDANDAVAVDPFVSEVLVGVRAACEAEEREMVHDATVMLIWHRPVEAPKACLKMDNGDVACHRSERTGEG
jgi:hypothetical protein